MKPDEAPQMEEWMNASEIADFLGLSRQSVSVLMRGGQFATLHKFGAENKPQLVVKRTEVEAYRESRENPTQEG